MLAVGLSEAEALHYLEKIVPESALVACVNSPSSVTLSGDVDSIAKLEEWISKDGKFAKRLRVQTAYHSPHMQLQAERYLELLGAIATNQIDATSVQMFSSVTGHQIDPSELGAQYWVRNMCEQVKFSQALTNLVEQSVSTIQTHRKSQANWSAILEIGPHSALEGPVNQILKASALKAATDLQYISMISRGQDAETTAIKAAGQLWSLGHDVNFFEINHHDEHIESLTSLTDLPAYPWNHSKGYWHESLTTRSIRFPSAARNDFLGLPVENQNAIEPRWQNRLRISENPWIEHHCITGTVLYPAAGMLIMVVEAALQMANPKMTLKGVTFENVHFERGLVIPSADQAVETSLSVQPHEAIPTLYSFTVFSITDGGKWTKHCFGKFSIVYEDTLSQVDPEGIDISDWREHANHFHQIKSQSTLRVNVAKLYEDLEKVGMEYGETFRNMTEVSVEVGMYRACGTVSIPDTKSLMPYEFEYPHIIHPATLDAIFHLLFVAFADGDAMVEASVPYTLEHMYIAASLPQGPGQEYIGYAQRAVQQGRETTGDIVVSDASWAEPKIVIRNFTMRQVTSGSDGADITTSGKNEAGQTQRRCVGIAWDEDVDFLHGAEAERVLQQQGIQQMPSHAPELHVWLNKLCHKNANCRALFVADDNEDVSAELSEILDRYGPLYEKSQRLSKCTIANASDALLASLHKLEVAGGLQVSTLDLDGDSVLPFEPNSFDLVVLLGSQNCNADRILRIIPRIKPATSKNAFFVLSFQSEGKEEEATTSSEIESSLNAANIQVIISLKGSGNRCHLTIAEALTRPQSLLKVTDLYLLDDPSSSAVVLKLKEVLSIMLRTHGIRIHTTSLCKAAQLKGQNVVSLLEIEKPFVKDWTSTQFEQFKTLISSAKHMLWITRGGQTLDPQDVDFASTTGLLRVIRNEYPQITLPHLDLSRAAALDTESVARLIISIWFSSISVKSSPHEMEFAELNGSVFIPRVVEESKFDIELELHSGKSQPIVGKLSSTRPMKIGADMVFIEDTDAGKDIDLDDVEIRVEAVSLNGSDLDSITVANLSSAFGREAAGVVTRLGSSVSRFSLGQRVVMMKKGCYRSYLRQHQSFVAAIPASLTAERCVALPHVYCTAWYALIDVARLSKGQSILIHNAAGGLGQAAIEIAQFIGAEVFATVGTKDKKNLLASHHKIAEDHIFDSRSTTFAKGVLQVTRGQGVDVVLHSRPGRVVAESCSCLAEFGHLVDLSKSLKGEHLALGLFRRNASLAALEIDKVTLLRPQLIETIFHKIFELAQMGVIGNISPILTFSITDLDKALRFIQSNKHSGKVVITFEKNANVPMLPPSPARLELDPAGTYILAGGLGSLGLDIATTMFHHGARHIVFLTRSGGSKNEQRLQNFRTDGLKVDALKCDIRIASEIDTVIRELIQNGCQIKGLVQCAMVLEDGIFETMLFSQWERAVQPKVQGTWNLHSLLPKDMDFFIMLSSVVCVIGNSGQANYAAGNTYEDAFAKYRRSQGLAASTINVGIVADSAHFIFEKNFGSYIEKYGHLASLLTTKDELGIALRAMMRGRTADNSPVTAQLVLGMSANISRYGLMTGSWAKDPKFIHRIQTESSQTPDVVIDTKTALKNATSFQETFEIVQNLLKEQVALAMGASLKDVDVEKPLYDFGGKKKTNPGI